MKNLQDLLTDFDSDLKKVIETTWSTTASANYLEALADGAQLLTSDIIETGDFVAESLATDSVDKFPLYLFHFNWTKKAKAFLILWRDVLFQAQKAQILSLENSVLISDLQTLKEQSRIAVSNAAEELIAYFENESTVISQVKKGREKQIVQWSLKHNPYPVYRKQLEELNKQCRDLVSGFEELKTVSEILSQSKNQIQTTLNHCKGHMDVTKHIAMKTIAYLENPASENIIKLPAWLEDRENELRPFGFLDGFSDHLNDISASLKNKMQVPVNTRGGLIQFKEVNFERGVRQWLESEILPVLNEVSELVENGNNGLKVSLFNIRNRAVLLSNELKEGRKADFENENLGLPLSGFLEKTTQREDRLEELTNLIDGRLQRSFGVFSVYNPTQNFLPLPLQSTINQFRTHQNKWLERILAWGKRQWATIQQFTTSVIIEESLSSSEKIVRLIQNRTTDPENYHYSSIFSTKGFIGESFWVGRKNELAHMEKLIEQWKEGFRGAVILTGQRLSGKSLFGDLVADRYFSKDTIRLAPDALINFQGRKFQCSTDLGESLDFIKKHSPQKGVLVWIDDLELWKDAEIPLSQNVRKLCSHIDNHSRQIFFMVSMSNWLKNHLNKIHDLDRKFQAEINLDQMSMAEIQEAILIRHGATHKVLVNSEGDKITSAAFQKISSKIHKTVHGNIGEALSFWSYSTFKYDEDKVGLTPVTSYGLPDFMNTNTAIVLSTLMMEKRSNEYQLRKLFGLPFKEKYGGIVQRLIGVGLLFRNPDGALEVNEVVANEVGRLLAQKQFLNFQSSK